MEEISLGTSIGQFNAIGRTSKRKRTRPSRPPKPESQSATHSLDPSPSSTSQPSDDVHKASSDENPETSSSRKDFNLNQCMSRASSATEAEPDNYLMSNNEGNGFCVDESGKGTFGNKGSSEGVLATANRKNGSRVKESIDSELINTNNYLGRNIETRSIDQQGVTSDSLGNDNKVKLKLKVGGVTRTFHANSLSNGSIKNSQSSKASRLNDKLEGSSKENHSNINKGFGLQGVPWKDFSTGNFSLGKESASSMGKKSGRKGGEKSESVRKSKRVSKRHGIDKDVSEESEDDEIRFLENLKNSKICAGYIDDDESSRKQRRLSSMSNVGVSKSVKDGKKRSSLDRASEETDYEEEDPASADELVENKKKQMKESVMDGKREMTLTTRQRALQSRQDGSASGSTLVEFPNGLPPAPSKKQKEQLTEVEQQLRKAEAAQKRRMQVEKANKESEAEAIRKILGQDSSRKKREDKIKKHQEERAREKAANALTLPPNTIRYHMGPTGVVMTFSNDIGLPSIFENKTHSYPPPREKCAGPSCTNPYKYRDSKSKLPLCSLECYKAVQEKSQAGGSN